MPSLSPSVTLHNASGDVEIKNNFIPAGGFHIFSVELRAQDTEPHDPNRFGIFSFLSEKPLHLKRPDGYDEFMAILKSTPCHADTGEAHSWAIKLIESLYGQPAPVDSEYDDVADEVESRR